MECKEASLYMHEYLDGTLTGKLLTELKKHVLECQECRRQLDGLEQTEAFLRVVPAPAVPDRFTERIMQALPKESKSNRFKRWIKRHPAASVAVVFLMVMMSSFLSLWDKESSLIVKGSDLEDVVIQGDTVIVPQGRTVNGDLTVENGTLQVDGAVRGNLIVIDGNVNLASTAAIAGQVTSINENIDYFWFRVKEFFSGFSR